MTSKEPSCLGFRILGKHPLDCKQLCLTFQYLLSVYHPQSNSAVERTNSIILQGFGIYCKDQQDDWQEILLSVMMTHRMKSYSGTTKFKVNGSYRENMQNCTCGARM